MKTNGQVKTQSISLINNTSCPFPNYSCRHLVSGPVILLHHDRTEMPLVARAICGDFWLGSQDDSGRFLNLVFDKHGGKGISEEYPHVLCRVRLCVKAGSWIYNQALKFTCSDSIIYCLYKMFSHLIFLRYKCVLLVKRYTGYNQS